MSNALIDARSPYLRAHAENPVAWQPWSDAALDRARREGRPLFVSVGYFACHWCHVMAREAFSDAGVATLLNANFVSIKVDREERPDIDRVLQVAHQALTGAGGGWPLSVFMDPESMTVFFAGTYFPLEARYGRPGFADLLGRIVELWRSRRTDLVAQGRVLKDHLQAELGAGDGAPADALPARASIAALERALAASFDPAHGGFGRSGPKFPQCPQLAFMLARGEATMLPATLDAIARGGLRDHLGGGFFRYTVDPAWRLPHFEKMLADNAQLLAIFAAAAVRFGRPDWRAVALETAAFIERELALADGGVATALNAEAGGDEGGFYLWDRDEARAIVGDADWPAFAATFGFDGPPQVDARWHLARVTADDAAPARARLAAARASRARPERDDKCLTRLNAMLVSALATAALTLDEPALAARARALFAHLRRTVVDGGAVMAVRIDGVFYQPGLLADYAELAAAALAIAALGDDGDAVALARRLTAAMLARFRTASGALAMTPADAEVLLYRPSADRDDELPAASAVAARVLQTLGHVRAEPSCLDAADAVLRAAAVAVERQPEAYPGLLGVLADALEPPPVVVLRGDDLGAWAAAVRQAAPGARLVWLRGEVREPELARYAARADGVAYVCRGLSCSAPIGSRAALLRALLPAI